MNLNTRALENNITIIEYLDENVDASNVHLFRENMKKLMQDTTNVIFNMSHINFIDSSGLGVLIACLRESNGNGGDFRLCSLTKSVSALMELMRLHRVFSILESEDLAINSFA